MNKQLARVISFAKKKPVITIGTVIVVLILVTGGAIREFQSRRFMKPVEIQNLPLSYQLVETRHFYEDLTEEEKEIYHKLEYLLDHYIGGEVVLEQPISSRSCFRVETALREDSEKYWYYTHLRPYDEKYMLVNAVEEQENPDKLIYKLILIVESEVYRRLMNETFANYKHSIDMLNELTEESDLIETLGINVDYIAYIFELTYGLPYYSEMAGRLKNKLPEFLNDLPDGIDRADAIQNYSQWLNDYLTTDPNYSEELYNDIIDCIAGLNELNSDLSYYSEMDARVEQKLQEIINEIPKGSNQEEAVQYFSQWLVDNMVYDDVFNEYITTNNYDLIDINKQLANVNITSINNGEGVCTGFVFVLNALCRRVGIDAYFVSGYVRGLAYGRHAWSAIIIGDETYYKDPTFEIGNQEVRPLRTSAQFYHSGGYKLFDWFEDLWKQ